MIVFRIENKYGDGPYRGDFEQSKWAEELHCERTGRPPPNKDGLKTLLLKTWRKNDEAYRSAFISKEQINNWFSKKELKRLQNVGFKIVCFKIKKSKYNVLFCRKQVLFKVKNSKKLRLKN